MAWRSVSVSDVKGRFLPMELATWQPIQSGNGEGVNLDAAITLELTDAVGTFLGAMNSAG